jgi:hypothetical protein
MRSDEAGIHFLYAGAGMVAEESLGALDSDRIF